MRKCEGNLDFFRISGYNSLTVFQWNCKQKEWGIRVIFAVDVGNTNIVLGAYREDQLVFVSRIATDSHKTEDQYAIEFDAILRLYHCCPSDFKGAIVSSVVPPLSSVLQRSLSRLFGCEVLLLSPGIKTGLNIRIDNPATLGSDLVCGAVAAIEKYGAPCIIFDLGTATTIAAVDRAGNYLGGSIIPGVRISLDALSARAAQLPYIHLGAVDKVIGTNSIDSMKSGSILGTACMIDGMIERYREVLGQDAKAIASGGLAEVIFANCRTEVIIDQNLLLDGLHMIYRKNR